jgi:hypothetical protein
VIGVSATTDDIVNVYVSKDNTTTQYTNGTTIIILTETEQEILYPFNTNANNFDEQASLIHNWSNSDQQFVQWVFYWVYNNINYKAKPGMDITSTDVTWRTRIGDCSELSLVYERMLSPYIKAHVVHGSIPARGLLHDTVRIYIDQYTRYIDDYNNTVGFIEWDKGIYPGEYITY